MNKKETQDKIKGFFNLFNDRLTIKIKNYDDETLRKKYNNVYHYIVNNIESDSIKKTKEFLKYHNFEYQDKFFKFLLLKFQREMKKRDMQFNNYYRIKHEDIFG